MRSMDVSSLVDLHRLAIHLGTPGLLNESERLIGAAVHKMDIYAGLEFSQRVRNLGCQSASEKVEGRLCFLLRRTALNSEQMKALYESTTDESNARATAVKTLARAVIHEQLDASVYEELCGEIPQFNDDLIKATPVHCTHCRKFGHFVGTCFKLHPDLVPKQQCTHCKQTGHLRSGCFLLHPDLAPPEKVCEHCKKYGHTKAQCFKLYPDKVPVRVKFAYAHCGKGDHKQDECWTEYPELVPESVRAARQSRTLSLRQTYASGSRVARSNGRTASLADFLKPARGSPK